MTYFLRAEKKTSEKKKREKPNSSRGHAINPSFLGKSFPLGVVPALWCFSLFAFCPPPSPTATSEFLFFVFLSLSHAAAAPRQVGQVSRGRDEGDRSKNSQGVARSTRLAGNGADEIFQATEKYR